MRWSSLVLFHGTRDKLEVAEMFPRSSNIEEKFYRISSAFAPEIPHFVAKSCVGIRLFRTSRTVLKYISQRGSVKFPWSPRLPENSGVAGSIPTLPIELQRARSARILRCCAARSCSRVQTMMRCIERRGNSCRDVWRVRPGGRAPQDRHAGRRHCKRLAWAGGHTSQSVPAVWVFRSSKTKTQAQSVAVASCGRARSSGPN